MWRPLPVLTGKFEGGPVRLDDLQRDGAGGERLAGGERVLGPVEPQERKRAARGRRAERPDRPFGGGDGGAGFGWKAVIGDRHDTAARNAAMLHPRHHFLADKTSLGEIDAMKLVHVGLVG